MNLIRKLGKWTAVAIASFVALILGVVIGVAAGGTSSTSAAQTTITDPGRTVYESTTSTVSQTVTETVSATKAEREQLKTRAAQLDQRAAALRQGERALQKEIGIVKRTSFGAGTYLVGREITPGTYRASGHGGCYWERLSGLGGDFGDIIANDNPAGQAIVAISSSDKAFSSERCGTWRRVS